ncbi:unnamed protein product, partial [Rotaria magnacalcarata]
QTDSGNYFENLLVLYLPIRNRDELKKPYQLFYENGIVYEFNQNCDRKVKDIVCENRKKDECHFDISKEMESIFNELATQSKEDDWAAVVATIEKNRIDQNEIENEENPDFELIHKKKKKSNNIIDLKQSFYSSNEIRPLLESMSEERQHVFYQVRQWCTKRLQNPDIEPIHVFITGGAGTEPDENIEEIHALITAFTGAAAVNVGGITIHSAFANQRQNNDGCFAQMLNRIRQMKKKSVMLKEDQDTLEKCHQRYLKNEHHPEALRLFSKNADVDAHNEEMIDLICTNIKTIYELDRKGQKIEPKTNRYGKQLYKPLRLAKNARIMLTKNICVLDVKAGVDHRRNCSDCKKLGTICATRENDSIDTEESTSSSTRDATVTINRSPSHRLRPVYRWHGAQSVRCTGEPGPGQTDETVDPTPLH